MRSHSKAAYTMLFAAAAVLVTGCDSSQQSDAPTTEPEAPETEASAPQSPEGDDLASNKEPVGDDVETLPLSFEWSAIGYKNSPERYSWIGAGGDTPYLALGVPETDDQLLTVACDAGQVVWKVNIMREAPTGPGTSGFYMEVAESSAPTSEYTAVIVPNEEFPHYAIDMEPGDPILDSLAKGQWLFMRAGDDDSREKVRIPLADIAEPLKAFRSACK